MSITAPVKEAPQLATIDDILDDAFLDSLEAGAPDIFTIKHIPLTTGIEAPDYVAQRKPCKDFSHPLIMQNSLLCEE